MVFLISGNGCRTAVRIELDESDRYRDIRCFDLGIMSIDMNDLIGVCPGTGFQFQRITGLVDMLIQGFMVRIDDLPSFKDIALRDIARTGRQDDLRAIGIECFRIRLCERSADRLAVQRFRRIVLDLVFAAQRPDRTDANRTFDFRTEVIRRARRIAVSINDIPADEMVFRISIRHRTVFLSFIACFCFHIGRCTDIDISVRIICTVYIDILISAIGIFDVVACDRVGIEGLTIGLPEVSGTDRGIDDTARRIDIDLVVHRLPLGINCYVCSRHRTAEVKQLRACFIGIPAFEFVMIFLRQSDLFQRVVVVIQRSLIIDTADGLYHSAVAVISQSLLVTGMVDMERKTQPFSLRTGSDRMRAAVLSESFIAR